MVTPLLALFIPSTRLTTSTQHITALQPLTQNRLAVATTGGLFILDKNDNPTQIPTPTSPEVTALRTTKTQTIAITPLNQFHIPNSQPLTPPKMSIPPPPGSPSQITIHNQVPIAAVLGSGLWQYKSSRWQPFSPPFQTAPYNTTAIVSHNQTLYLGTSNNSLFKLKNNTWIPVPLPGSNLPSHNIVNFFQTPTALWAFTLDQGILEYTNHSWSPHQPTSLIKLPRHAIQLPNRTLLLDSESKIWLSDSQNREFYSPYPPNTHTKPLNFISLAGSNIIRLSHGFIEVQSANNNQRTSPINPDLLQGFPTTVAAASKAHIYIGTQNSGLAKFDLTTKELSWINRGPAFHDDWITALTYNEQTQTLAIGTFVGGLSLLKNNQITHVPSTQGQNITTLLSTTIGFIFGTRRGLYILKNNQTSPQNITPPNMPTEVQALTLYQNQLFIGTRTGIIQTSINQLLL